MEDGLVLTNQPHKGMYLEKGKELPSYAEADQEFFSVN